MSTQANDEARYKEEQRQQWDGVAAGWKKWWPTIENGARHVSRRMIELAEVERGHRVLDIAVSASPHYWLQAALVLADG